MCCQYCKDSKFINADEFDAARFLGNPFKLSSKDSLPYAGSDMIEAMIKREEYIKQYLKDFETKQEILEVKRNQRDGMPIETKKPGPRRILGDELIDRVKELMVRYNIQDEDTIKAFKRFAKEKS